MRDGVKQMPSASQREKRRTSKKKCTTGITWDVGSKRLLGCLRLQLNGCLECGFPGNCGKESTCQCKKHRRRGFFPWVGKIPWRRKWQPTPVFLPGKSHGQRSLACYSPWDCEESDTAEHVRRMIKHTLCKCN